MSDSCNATRISIKPEKKKDFDKRFNEYVQKYCEKHNCTIAKALTHKIVIAVYQDMLEREN